jgi:hypothetical protein
MLNETKKTTSTALNTAPPTAKAAKAVNWGNQAEALKRIPAIGRSEARLVSVTPQLAAEWLSTNTDNRPIRKRQVEILAKDMKLGNWLLNSSDMIMIGSNSVLLNGQHRLSAVVESGVTVRMFVLFGAEPDATPIDRNIVRSWADIHQMNTGVRRHRHWYSIANAMRTGAAKRSAVRTATEMERFYDQHEKAISFATECSEGARRGVNRASVGAVIARAFGHVDRATLKDFADVLRTGIAPSAKYAIVMTLRDWLVTHPAQGGSVSATVAYRKTARALLAFINGERIKTLYEISEEPWPLADEVKGKSKRGH